MSIDSYGEEIKAACDTFENALEHAVNFVLSQFSDIRAGRVSPSLVEGITVEYYGTPTRLKDIATITNEDSRTLIINPWDVSIRPEVGRVLMAANVGANPIDNGQNIRMTFPALTEDRRKELCKQVRQIAEDGRVTMRNARRDVMQKTQKIAKETKLSEDEQKGLETDIQKILNDYIANLDSFLTKKETEIMAV
ncbi:MAG: ribosome recycling factor [Firmicutes bacterium]|nr:ribosome recycling factor [Bacillota bacterium]